MFIRSIRFPRFIRSFAVPPKKRSRARTLLASARVCSTTPKNTACERKKDGQGKNEGRNKDLLQQEQNPGERLPSSNCSKLGISPAIRKRKSKTRAFIFPYLSSFRTATWGPICAPRNPGILQLRDSGSRLVCCQSRCQQETSCSASDCRSRPSLRVNHGFGPLACHYPEST